MSKFLRAFKNIRARSAGALLALGVAGGMLAGRANAATQFLLPGGVSNGNTYSWDGPTNWSATSTSGSANQAWTQGNFAEFTNGNTYTVTVGADEQNVGLFETSGTGNVTINRAPSTSGQLDVITAIQGFLVASGGSLTINAPIVGNGGVAPESPGSLSLFGNNSYTGGTALGDSGNNLTFFNSSSSFGTGGITLNRTNNFSTLLSTGGAPITLPNNFSTVVANTGPTTDLNFASGANTPVTSTGSWTLGTVNLGLRNNGDSTAPLTLSGGISGTGNIAFSGQNNSKTTISGSSAANSGFTGTLTIGGGAGENAITVVLGAPNTLTGTTGVTLAGATLDAGGFAQSMTSAALGMTASSTITEASGQAEVDFANSSAQTWTGTLNILDYNEATGPMRFGTDSTGLTSTQLADIEFDGNAATLGTAFLDPNGYLLPEPTTLGLLGLVGAGLLGRRRRKA